MPDRVVLVGQAPSRRMDGGPPLSGETGRKLARLAGLADEADLARRFCLVNLLGRWPGHARGKGDSFPVASARAAWERLAPGLEGRRVVFVGLGVADAAGFAAEPMTWVRFNGGWAAALPHPSGVNLWWNKELNRTEARAFMVSLAMESAT